MFQNYRTGACVSAAPKTLEILALFDDWQDPVVVARRLPEYSPASFLRAVKQLVGCSLLERSDQADTAADRLFDSWKTWHPAAGLLHFSSKDLPYLDAGRAQKRLRARAMRHPRPAAVKRYPRAKQMPLPAPRTDGEFPRVLLGRRTWRRFSSRPVPLAAIGTLLGLSCAVQHWVDVPGVGRLPMKTYPSGGSQHPLEVYLLARRVDGLASGLYHYAADTHRLERLRAGATGRQIERYLPRQPWFRTASALIVFTAVFPRMQWKYAFARAYRAVLTEAGHACQTLCLTATWLGLAPFCTLALADSLIERDLGIDGVSESVLYVAGVGTRPPLTEWAPWPTHRGLRRTKNNIDTM